MRCLVLEGFYYVHDCFLKKKKNSVISEFLKRPTLVFLEVGGRG